VFRIWVVLILFAGTLFADAPLAVYLTWNDDPTTTMLVQWIDEQSVPGEVVFFAETNVGDALQKTASVKPLLEGFPYYVHSAAISRLQPNSSYRFRIAGETQEYRCKTMPQDLSSPLTFVVGGDVNMKSADLFLETNKLVAAHRPSFVVIGGDLTSTSFHKKTPLEWCQQMVLWLTTWSQTMKTPDGYLIPLLVTIGNHDVDKKSSKGLSRVPFLYTLFPAAKERGYATMRFGNYLSLYLLDSGHVNAPGGVQGKWLQKELIRDVNVLHRIAIYHVPAYPPVRPYRSNISSSLRRHWVPLFDRYHLHLAFENHDHAYKRTYPMTNGKVDPRGVVYIGNGSWGVEPRIPKNACRTMFLEKTERVRQFCTVCVSKEQRIVCAIASDNQVVDMLLQPVSKPLQMTAMLFPG
jgi:hypothetical protein